MMNMKSRAGMFMAMAGMFAAIGGNSSFIREGMGVANIKTDEEKERQKRHAQLSLNRAKGLQEFYYSGSSKPIWAINQKVADKKAKKLGLL